MERRPDYGIDAPLEIAIQLLISGGCFGLAALLFGLGVAHPLGIPVGEIALLVGANVLVNVGSMVWYSLVGKLRQRDRLLDLISWTGKEAVLDVGCGRGLLVIGAARRLTTGKAVGIDLWQRRSLMGNRPEMVWENARCEGVADRVEVLTGDATRLPFPDASFDVVVSALVVHNIPGRANQRRAVREMARVLKPGGQLVALGIMHTSDWTRVLRASGVSDARRSPAGALFWWFAIFSWGFVQFFRVTGTKDRADPDTAAP